jgi:hypothetical protein
MVYFVVVLTAGLLFFSVFFSRLSTHLPLLFEVPGTEEPLPGELSKPEPLRYTTPVLGNVHDFVLFYAAGKMADEPLPPGSNLYDHKRFNEVLAEITKPLIPRFTFRFQYPPFFFVLLKPLAQLRLVPAWAVWAASQTMLQVLCTFWLLAKEKRPPPEVILAAFTGLMILPSYANISGGQTAAMLLFGLTSLFCLCYRDRFFAAGLVSSIAFLKIQYAPALFLCGLCLGKLKYLRGTLLAGLILLALSVLSTGWTNVLAFPASILSAEVVGERLGAGDMATFRGFLQVLAGKPREIPLIAGAIAYPLSLSLIVYLWIKLRPRWSRKTGHSFEICASLSTLLALMFTIHGWVYDYVAAILPCLWLWSWLRDEANVGESGSGKCLKFLLLAFPFVTFLVPVCFLKGEWFVCFLWALAVCINVFVIMSGPLDSTQRSASARIGGCPCFPVR